MRMLPNAMCELLTQMVTTKLSHWPRCGTSDPNAIAYGEMPTPMSPSFCTEPSGVMYRCTLCESIV